MQYAEILGEVLLLSNIHHVVLVNVLTYFCFRLDLMHQALFLLMKLILSEAKEAVIVNMNPVAE